MRNAFLALPLAACLLSTSAIPLFAQSTPVPVDVAVLAQEVSGIDAEIASAEADLKKNNEGLLAALVQVRLDTLKLTRAILQNQIAATNGGAVTEITVPVAGPDEKRAGEILADIENQMKVISEAEAEAGKLGGLPGALAASRVLTEKLTLATLRAAWMEAKYGTILPVALSTPPARVAEPSSQPAGATASDEAKSGVPPEWADPQHPEIDYDTEIFRSLHSEGFKIHGWWGVQESRAPIDDSPQVFAINASAYKKQGFMSKFPKLNMACREGEASLIFQADDIVMGDFQTKQLKTTIRIDGEPARTSQWSELSNRKGAGLFGAPGQDMIRDILSAEKLFVRIEERSVHDATFSMAGTVPVAELVAAACGFSLLDLSTDDYRAIQTMLNAAGFNAGTPDGVWGSGSAEALRKWQEGQGLPATGAPDRATLAAMGI